VEPTSRREIVHWDFSPPVTISQATSHAQLQLLNISAATTTIIYVPDFGNTLTFFEMKESASFGKASSQGTLFESVF